MNRSEFLKTLPGKIKKAVQKLDHKGIVIDNYDSGKEAANMVGVSGVAISMAIKYGYKSAGYYWRHKKADLIK